MRPVGPGGALAPIALARLSVTYGRLLTLGAVDEIEPGVLDDLGGQPFEALNRSSWNADRDGLLSYEVILADPRLRDLRASLEAWSDRWHLNDKWCLELAVSALTHKWGGERSDWFEPRPHFGGMALPFRALFLAPLGLRPYDPVREWRADYLAHARRVLNPKYQALDREMSACLHVMNRTSSLIEQDRLLAHARELGDRLQRVRKLAAATELLISEYLDRVESAARAEGLVQVPSEFRQPMVFRWLAAYQVCGWSPRQIARATRVYQTSEVYHNAIVHGITRLAGHIGLALRWVRPFYPRRSNLDSHVEEIRAALRGERLVTRRALCWSNRPPRRELTPEEKLAEARRVVEVLLEVGVTEISDPKSGDRIRLDSLLRASPP